MFNLLRMDLYRLKRSKSIYICFGLMLLFMVLCYWFVWMMSTPAGRESAAKIGMDVYPEDYSILEGYDSIAMFRESGMDGGMYTTIIGIITALFICADCKSGFLKNILTVQRNRVQYIISKILTAGILNLFYLPLLFGLSLLLNMRCGDMVPYSKAADVLFYLLQAWLITTAFSALTVTVCTFTRSTAAGVLTATFLGSGAIVSALYGITGLFHANGWAEYTLYFTLNAAPQHYTGIGDLRGIAVGAVFLILYTAISAVTLTKQDI